MGEHLKPSARIVHSPTFENGIVKVINGTKLTSVEVAALEQFDVDEDSGTDRSGAVTRNGAATRNENLHLF
ncbi:hypothetical protein ON010_g9749 [Phytophthora cinnamomi]|nr:hypothetical protein ON010_g9749 [Phytophthora cinnamomi]